MTSKAKKVTLAAAIGIAVVLLGIWSAAFYLNYLDIYEVGVQYTRVFWVNFSVSLLARAAVFAAIFILALLTNMILRRNLLKWERTSGFLTKTSHFMVMSLLIAIAGAAFVDRDIYTTILTALNPSWFAENDPVLHKNIGYYVFQRPLFMQLTRTLLGLSVFLAAYVFAVILLYYVRNGIKHPSELLKQKGIIAELTAHVLLCFLVSAYHLHFQAEELLFRQNGDMVGGGYTDINVWLNFYRIMPYVLIVIVVGCIWFLLRGRFKRLLVCAACYPAAWLLTGAIAVCVQNFAVLSNEAAMERPYIRHNIEATLQAYNLAETQDLEYPLSDTLDPNSVTDDIIDNIRITDYNATLTAYNQPQGIRDYYQFKDVDVIPYQTTDGERKSAFISVREMQPTNSGNKMTYINEKMRFTHGYGIVMSSTNTVTSEGQPDFLVKNIPLQTTSAELPTVTEPRIYFGELSDDSYVLVNTAQKELDYAEGQTENEYSYQGPAGIEMTALNRLLYAIRYGDINFITSQYIHSDSRMLLNRNVVERVRNVVPFLTFDDDVHITITNDGRLKWVVDGYTTTEYYPYAQRTDGYNYIRNSVKALVDAYSGTVELYIIDHNDPIIQTYSKVYPGIFKSEPLPYDVSLQIKYPEKLFQIQANIYKKYHTTDPATFYAQSDVWEIAREKYGIKSEIQAISPYYNFVDIGGESEFMLMVPYTLNNKDTNLVGWIGVMSDGENYGKMVSYKFPKGKHVYGTLQIENKIDNDPTISKELTLWGQGGSTVMRGNLLVIPIKNSIVYVEPVYITSQNSAGLPEVKRVILAYGDTVIMAETLEKAFEAMFKANPQMPNETTATVTEQPQSVNEALYSLSQELTEKYAEAKQFLSENDWENYGKTMKEVEALIADMQKLNEEIAAHSSEDVSSENGSADDAENAAPEIE